MAEHGKLIVLEAVDHVALARLAEELCRWMRGRDLAVEHTHEPTYGPAGTLILLARQGRLQFDATSLALLYLADRLDHAQRTDGIETWRAAGRHVICTHYGLAAAAQLWGQVELDWLDRIDAIACAPDLILYVDSPARGSMQKRLQKGYRAAVQHLQKRGQGIVAVDGTVAPELLHSTCQKHVARLLGLELAGVLTREYGDQ